MDKSIYFPMPEMSGETEEDIVVSAAEHLTKKHGKRENNIAMLREKLGRFIYTISY
jgi:hypothetical protein